MRSLCAFTVAVVARSALVKEHRANPADLLDTFRSTAARKLKDGELPEDTVNTLQGLLNDIQQQMETALRADIVMMNTELEGRREAVNACHPAHETRRDEMIMYDPVVQQHDACRVVQTDTEGAEDRECGELQTITDYFLGAQCAIPSDMSHDTQEVYNYMQCTHSFVHGSTPITEGENSFVTQREECQRGREETDDQVTVCINAQHDAVNAYCQRQTDTKSSCDMYSTCYDTAHAAWLTELTEGEQLELTIRDQWAGLDALLCYGEIIFGTSTNADLSICPTRLQLDNAGWDETIGALDDKKPNDKQDCDTDVYSDVSTSACVWEQTAFAAWESEAETRAEHRDCEQNSCDAVGDITIQMPTGTDAADHAPPLQGSWFLSERNSNCDAACESHGLTCTEEGLMAHNADVSTSAGLIGLISELGYPSLNFNYGTLSNTCADNWGEAPTVPNFFTLAESQREDYCHVSAPDRALETFDCARDAHPASQNKRRLCYCHH